MIIGFWAVEDAGVPPVKDQLHEVGIFVLKSVKETVLPSHKVVGVPLNSATGAELQEKFVITPFPQKDWEILLLITSLPPAKSLTPGVLFCVPLVTEKCIIAPGSITCPNWCPCPNSWTATVSKSNSLKPGAAGP